MYLINVDSIKEHLILSEKIIKNLKYNKTLYEQKKAEIESDIASIQFITEEKVITIKKKGKENLKNMYLKKYNNDNYDLINDSLFIRGSMLFDIKDFRKANNIFKSMYIFKKEEEEDIYEIQNLIKKNYHVTCHIYDEYDLYEINYELKAVGLPDDMFFNTASFGFVLGTNIEIIEFEIDSEKANYLFEKYTLRFDIKLKNLESKKIHIKYKESPLYEKLSKDEKEMRTLYRSKYYGISKRLVGQSAKFILINESNFEIINLRMSKKQAKVNFYEKHLMKTIDKLNIKNTVIKIPFCYMEGNNTIIEYYYQSTQTEKIKQDKNKKVFEVIYRNTNSTEGDFIIKGVLLNKCKGEWIVNLSNEEIDSFIPPDFKTNKEAFKTISYNIIKQYDEEHKDDLVLVPNVTKIGKWIKKNIKYDLTYVGLNDITATETYNTRKGVCHHITKLFNALMYSLGYQVIYILGYAADKKTTFSIEDAHCWSLIKIDGKWLPFDATWGIFSGKLPVTHVFKQFESKGAETLSYDKLKFEQIFVQGNII